MKNVLAFKKRVLAVALLLMFLMAYLPFSAAASNVELSENIVILYTNDVHTYIDGSLSYDVIAGIKDDLQTKYKHVILADAGDHIQGTAYGAMDKGENIIKLMNAAGYDVATLGNHEFDYNMQGCLNAIDWAEFSYISCNFYHENGGVRGDNVLDSYVMFDCGEEKVAFVGITTPETFSKSSTSYFQDGNGNFIYGISGGDDGCELRNDVQKAIDDARAGGATKVIALGHLGVDPSSTPWTSEETISGVYGLDAFIDGHSHTVMESKNVKDKAGNDVLLTQTGEYFNRIGMMIIDAETGDITTDFIEYDEETGALCSDFYNCLQIVSDVSVKEIKDKWMKDIDDKLGQKIGYSDVTFDNYDVDGNRLVRNGETNSGDFAADALYFLFDKMDLDVDIAVMNGGGIRNQAITGDITYKTCKDIHPFGNVACLQTVTGQQILDMLEWGARHAGESEDGSFLHVSGITYKVDTLVEDTTQAGELDIWVAGPVKYRVFDVTVYNKETDTWEELDMDATYNLAGYNYTLRDLGGGFAMLDGAVNVLDYVMEDYMVLVNYVEAFENGTIEADNSPLLTKYPNFSVDYGSVKGSGRIEVIEKPAVYVGGVKITEDNASDVFGDGKVSYNDETKTLTLNGYEYEGDGYTYYVYENGESGIREIYSAVIYSEDSLIIELVGDNTLINTSSDSAENIFGNCIVVSDSLSVVGDGGLHLNGSFAVEVEKDVVIDGVSLSTESTYDAIKSAQGEVIVKNDAKVYIESQQSGIYTQKDITIIDSDVSVNAEGNGIYSLSGNVIIDSTETKISDYGPWIEGTRLNVKAGGDYGIFACKGLTVNGKLVLSAPDGADIGEIYDDENNSYYSTILAGDTVAKDIEITPLGYYVDIEGLKNSMRVLVPAGKSLNDAYCEMFGVEDFSKVLKTEREGYTFGGWYTDEACSPGNEFMFDTAVNNDVTIYAKWVENDDIIASPPTGDSSDATMWIAFLVISGSVFVLLSAYGNKKKVNEK